MIYLAGPGHGGRGELGYVLVHAGLGLDPLDPGRGAVATGRSQGRPGR
jgi:hypothetical protein